MTSKQKLKHLITVHATQVIEYAIDLVGNPDADSTKVLAAKKELDDFIDECEIEGPES